jgi:hypothetical protein
MGVALDRICGSHDKESQRRAGSKVAGSGKLVRVNPLWYAWRARWQQENRLNVGVRRQFMLFVAYF